MALAEGRDRTSGEVGVAGGGAETAAASGAIDNEHLYVYRNVCIVF